MLSVVVWCCLWLCVISWWLKMSQVAVGCCKLLWDVTSGSRRLIDVVWCYHLPLSVALCCRLLSSADVVWCYWTPHVAVCCGVMLSVAACGWMLSFAILSHIMLLLVVVCWCILSLGDYRCYKLQWVVESCSERLKVAVWCWVLWCDAACGCVSSVDD